MVRRVMLDALFTLFATLLAIGIASPDHPGDQPDAHDFILVVYQFPENAPASPHPVPPILQDPQKRVVIPRFAGTMAGGQRYLSIAPAAPGTWQLKGEGITGFAITRGESRPFCNSTPIEVK